MCHSQSLYCSFLTLTSIRKTYSERDINSNEKSPNRNTHCSRSQRRECAFILFSFQRMKNIQMSEKQRIKWMTINKVTMQWGCESLDAYFHITSHDRRVGLNTSVDSCLHGTHYPSEVCSLHINLFQNYSGCLQTLWNRPKCANVRAYSDQANVRNGILVQLYSTVYSYYLLCRMCGL